MEVEKSDTNPFASQAHSSTPFSFSQPPVKKRQIVELEQLDVNMEEPSQYYNDDETQANPDGFFQDTKVATACSVRVALRVRPLIGRECYESPNICVSCYPESNQLIIGKDRAFTFDKIFDIGTRQQDVFDVCVKNLVLGCFSGYNATVLAYGQTGSGKTHTMGSGYTIGLKQEELGIIPRVIKLIFDEVDKRKAKAEFLIKCTFLEIYNEELHDLLDHNGAMSSMSAQAQSNSTNAVMDRFMQKKEITIREEKNGNISVYGLREEKVSCYEELAACLDRGSNFRSTASTLMNNCSSRSHAIFTISIEQHVIEDLYKAEGQGQQPVLNPTDAANEEFMVAKFHFVDLAGSERAKRTGATGATLKEGISINKGLLALGNVISALTEEGKKMNHVPYRDSKLTRILQDSLGGNSRTSMIACVSPAEINFEETLNTLKYASRARNIKNKPIVNRDPNSAQIAQLRQQVYELQRELLGCRKVLVSNNIEFEQNVVLPDLNGGEMKSSIGEGRQFTMGAQEIQRLEQEIKELKAEKSGKEKRIQMIQIECESVKELHQQSQLELFSVQKERDITRFQLEQVTQVLKKRGIFEEILLDLQGSPSSLSNDSMDIDEQNPDALKDPFLFGMSNGPGILEEYQLKVEEQKKELGEKNQLVKQLQKDYEMLFESAQQDTNMVENKEKEIERLKRSVNKLQKENVQMRNDQRKGINNKPQQLQQQTQPQLKKSMSPFQAPQKKKGQQPFQDASNKHWLSNELDYNIKHFNELFIENLSQSLSTMLVAKKGNTTVIEANKDGEEDKKQYNQEEDEEDDSSDDEKDNEEEEEPIDEELKLKATIEAIEQNEDNRKQDEEMKNSLKHQEQQIVYMEGDLKDKESLLEAIKESQKMLQNNLLEAMKNEYHKKISYLDSEIKQLEKERNENLKKADGQVQKNKVEEGYKKKLKDLDDKLKDLKKKDMEQNGMMKEASKQKLKIKTLEVEIDKMKTQKVGLMKKMKQESEEHRKWKNERGMELIKMKQSNMRKDQEIVKLKRENLRKELLAKRKQEELSALQRKTKSDKQKQINANNQRKKKKNIDVGKIQEWIISNTDKMLKFKELRQLEQQEIIGNKEVEEQIVEEQGQLAKLNVRKQKLEIKKAQIENMGDCNNEDEIYQISEEIDGLEMEIKSIMENIESLEEKQDFIQLKITNINTELIGLSPDDVEQLRFEEVQSIEGARACLGAFFGILLDVNVYKKQLENQTLKNEATIDALKNSLDELMIIQKGNEISFQKELEQINGEYLKKEEMMIRLIMENGGIDMEQMIGTEGKGGQDIFRQYLKSKENEILEIQNNNAQLAASQIGSVLKKNVKPAVLKNSKDQVYNQSKTALSKRVAELERKSKEDEKKFESLRHRFEQTNQEKELYKRQFDNAKQKLKTQEIQDVKNSKINTNEDNNNNNQTKSPKSNVNQQTIDKEKQAKLLTLHEVRKERKIKKLGGNNNNNTNNKGQDPKVIADEPMEEDEIDSPTIQENIQRRPTAIGDSIINQSQKQILHQYSESLIQRSNNEGEQSNVFSRLSQIQKNRAVPQSSSMVSSNSTNQNNYATNSLNTSQSQMIQPLQQNEQLSSGFDDDHKWKCLLSKDAAHNGQICALASVGNQLYSTSNKSLKIWDLDTMTCVSDIQAHSGFIKCMSIWESKNLMLTASDKVIMLWDLISLTNVGVLKGHKDEIRAMNVTQDGHILFSAGKGSQNGGALLLWDLRKGAQPFDEKEKQQDIFSLASTKDHLFYGCRNHQVYPMNLKTYEILHPFDPPHFDVVTSLSILDNTLVSGSRDKNLRCWDYSNLSNKYSDVMQAHSDWINAMETDHDRKEMYSGGKDGVVKVWKSKNRKLKCMAALSSNSGSINCLSKIDKQFGKMFALGSSDKSIRMWKFKDKYLNELNNSQSPEQKEQQNQQDDEFFSQEIMDNRNNDVGMMEEDLENEEIEIYGKEEEKQQKNSNGNNYDNYTQKYQPVRQAVQAIGGQGYSSVTTLSNPSQKLQQMRRQKRLQENQKRQQKENDAFQ